MALAQNANLTVLKLGYNNLGDAGVITLAAGIVAHKSLNLLDLGFNNIGDEGIIALVHSNSSNSYSNSSTATLHTLYLAGNQFGEDGAIAMADFLRQGSRLRKLFMTGNRIGGDGVKAITEAILEQEIQMRELYLGGTGMGLIGCQAVARLLEKSWYLRVISLPNCDIGDDEICMLASCIKSNKGRLPIESLQLSFNNISYKGLEAVANALWGSTTLKELKVDNNIIGDRGAHQMAAIIPTMKVFKILDVGFNKITASGLTVLMKTIAESQTLESLSVSGNAIDSNAAKSVAFALAYNCSLQSIFLIHCSIGHEELRHIAAGIVSNSRTSLHRMTGF
ncbi:RNI-like protein, partial [Fragilariopsis cylindrus CCMP1102]